MEQESVSICEQLGVTIKFTFIPLSQAKARKLFSWFTEDEFKLCYECEIYKDGVFVCKTSYATGNEIPNWVYGPFVGNDVWRSIRKCVKEIVCETGKCVSKPKNEAKFFNELMGPAGRMDPAWLNARWQGYKPEPILPKSDDILYCLVSDAQCAYYARTFEEFCADLGYSDDSIQALKAYEGCKTALIDLMRHFDFQQLCQLFEDY